MSVPSFRIHASLNIIISHNYPFFNIKNAFQQKERKLPLSTSINGLAVVYHLQLVCGISSMRSIAYHLQLACSISSMRSIVYHLQLVCGISSMRSIVYHLQLACSISSMRSIAYHLQLVCGISSMRSIVYHQAAGEYSPKVLMRYKGGVPPLMIYTSIT